MFALIVKSLIVGSALLLAVAAFCQSRGVTRLRKALEKETAARAQLEQQINALLECSLKLGSRVREQDVRAQAFGSQLQSIVRHAESASNYGDAHRLLKEGLEVEKVASICELSQGEAALLSRWSARRATG